MIGHAPEDSDVIIISATAEEWDTLSEWLKWLQDIPWTPSDPKDVIEDLRSTLLECF